MSKTATSLLVPALLCMVVGGAFNLGLINAHDLDALYTILPTGAVLFGLFLIVVLMEKEHALQVQELRVSETGRGKSGGH